jgi:RNA polymerase-binding protein DksA
MEIKEVRKILENEDKRLNIELGLCSGPSSIAERSASPFNKKMEAASQMQEMEQKLDKSRRIQQQIGEVKHALEKIEKGTYGICDGCGKQIAPARLEAVPQAAYCMDCKIKQRRSLLSTYAR